jgi:CMP/dCMP kinase
MKKLIIAIDGPAGSGKSTVSRLVAKSLGILYLDTGAMYRAAALEAQRRGIDFTDGPGLYNMCLALDLHFITDGNNQKIMVGDEDITTEIRSPEMDMLASRISAVKEVREAMSMLQRKIGMTADGLVAEGRDMGTVVFPDAEHKFFVTASVPERAHRRYQERVSRGEPVSMEKVEEDLKKRDAQDSGRAIAPLRPADDAEIIDTTGMAIEQVIEDIIKKIEMSARTGNVPKSK